MSGRLSDVRGSVFGTTHYRHHYKLDDNPYSEAGDSTESVGSHQLVGVGQVLLQNVDGQQSCRLFQLSILTEVNVHHLLNLRVLSGYKFGNLREKNLNVGSFGHCLQALECAVYKNRRLSFEKTVSLPQARASNLP